jgi:hypothetical protein
MRVRLQSSTWAITLVPWYEATARDDAGPFELSAARLRMLIREQPGAASGLRALLHELGEAPGRIELTDDAALAERIAELVARGHLRVEYVLPEVRVTTPPPRVESFTREYQPAPDFEDDDHWIEVELLGENGSPVAGQRCRVTLPDGREVLRTTDRFGLVRIDDIPAGTCTICFPDLDAGATAPLSTVARQGSQATRAASTAAKHWVEVELLGEDGLGIAKALCEITLPDGKLIRRRTDARGLIRVDGIRDAGDCKFSFVELDAPVWSDEVPEMLPGRTLAGTQAAVASSASKHERHWVEVELVGEDGVGVAGQPCEITLPDGKLVRRKTDARGLIRIDGIRDAGDCTISFAELDATAWGGETPAMAPGRTLSGTQAKPAAAAATSPRHWVEVELVGEDGLGVAGARCEVKLPDGRVLERRTDAAGVIRIDGLTTVGDCEISFPDFDAAAWSPQVSV